MKLFNKNLFIAVVLVFISCLNFTFRISAKILKVIEESDPILRAVSYEVKVFDDGLAKLLDNMRETMEYNNGCGIAAPQVGVLKRIIIVKVNNRVTEYINPTIEEQHGEQKGTEGCLSIPNVMGVVKRPQFIKGFAYNRSGERFEFSAKNFEARVILHEIDHLNGILYIDKAISKFTKTHAIVGSVLVSGIIAVIVGAITVMLR